MEIRSPEPCFGKTGVNSLMAKRRVHIARRTSCGRILAESGTETFVSKLPKSLVSWSDFFHTSQ